MKRIVTALAVMATTIVAATSYAKLYSHPTWDQMERAIAAAQGVPYVPRPSAKTDPTFDQMERLITAIQVGGGATTGCVSIAAFDMATNELWVAFGAEAGAFISATNDIWSAVSSATNDIVCATNGLWIAAKFEFTASNDFVYATNEFHEAVSSLWTRTTAIERTKRDKDDLAVYRKVKDIWTWTSYTSNGWSTADAPADFLASANSPGAQPLVFRGGEGGFDGGWFYANQYWPNGNVKYDQGPHFSGDLGALSTNLYFAFTAYAEDGKELLRFGAKAHRESATDERLVDWFAEGPASTYPVRLVTTDLLNEGLKSVDPWTEDRSGQRTAVSIGGKRTDSGQVGQNSLTVGYEAAAPGFDAVAIGSEVTARGEDSIAFGNQSVTTEEGGWSIAAGVLATASNTAVVVWNSNVNEHGDEPYGDHGPGTFNVKPAGGLTGFYVGESNLQQHVERITDSRIAKAEAHDTQKYLRVIDFFDTFESDADWYADWADEHGYCASLRVGNVYVRNYDWKYTEAMTYVGRLPAASGRYASVFVCNVGTNLTPAIEATGEWTRFHRALPGRAVDGINEKGVVCNINVVPTNGVPWETRGGERDLSLTRACRYVLDNFDNARAAADYVAAHGYIPDALKNQGFSIHMMIADPTGSYIVEDGEVGAFAVSTATGEPAYMTNFRVVTNQVTDVYGSGLERWDVLRRALSGLDPELSAAVAITNLWYTHGYIRDRWNNYPWPTEFAGVIAVTNAAGNVTNVVETQTGSPWEYKLKKFDTELLHQVCNLVIPDVPHDRWPRDGSSWQTIHCSVYDISNRCLRIAVQEDPRWTVVSVPAGGAGGIDQTAAVDLLTKTNVFTVAGAVSNSVVGILTDEHVRLEIGSHGNLRVREGDDTRYDSAVEIDSRIEDKVTTDYIRHKLGLYLYVGDGGGIYVHTEN